MATGQAQLLPDWSGGLGADLGSPRYERKFLQEIASKSQLELMAKLHPAAFSQAFPPRFVNNIYLDTPELHNYWDNVVGNRSRLKVRLRWYGNMLGKIEQPVLELKAKQGLLGWKAQYQLKGFTLERGFSYASLEVAMRTADLPPQLRLALGRLEPTLLNRYWRQYLLSADRCYRLTVDSDLEFYGIRQHANSFVARFPNIGQTILELKYAPEHDESAAKVSGWFPLRVTKSSKYVTGIDLLGNR